MKDLSDYGNIEECANTIDALRARIVELEKELLGRFDLVQLRMANIVIATLKAENEKLHRNLTIRTK